MTSPDDSNTTDTFTRSLIVDLHADLVELCKAIHEKYLTMHESFQGETKALLESVDSQKIQLGYAIERASKWMSKHKDAFNTAAHKHHLNSLDYAFIAIQDAKDLPALRARANEAKEKFKQLCKQNDHAIGAQLKHLKKLKAASKKRA